MTTEGGGTVPVEFGGTEEKGETLMKKMPKGGGISGVVVPVGVILAVVFAGVGTGWFLAQSSGGIGGGEKVGMAGAGPTKKIVGLCTDEATFRDDAEGVLEEEGVNGEGTHHLTREGGVSQNVYLTSTSVDLDEFVGKKVKVKGETVTAQKAGWLMDVGCVELL